MQKLNNFIYMIAAAIVSNLVYAINGISAYAAGPYMLVYSAPYANSIKGCYIQGTGGFDNTGIFEYTRDSACYFR